MKYLVSKELRRLKKIHDCKGHEWGGPLEAIRWVDRTVYLAKCKHCPAKSLFESIEDFEQAHTTGKEG